MLTKENIQNIYPLSPMQEGMYFHSLYDNTSRAYFIQFSYRISGKLNIPFVEKSLNELFRRYDILRTVFIRKKAERLLQVVLRERVIDFCFEDISMQVDKEGYIEEFKEKDKQKSFDLGKDVLMRVAVLKLAEDEYEFTWSFHHILMDGWCINILVTEFSEIYGSFVEGRPYRLPDAKQYRLYIKWLEKLGKENSKKYWKEYLQGYEEITGIPKLSTAENPAPGYKLEHVTLRLDKEIVNGLYNLAVENNATLNMVIQSVWALVLGKYSGRRDVLFGAVVSGRPPEIEGVEAMVGLFINTVPVRIQFPETGGFVDLLKKVRAFSLESEPHHYYSLADIQTESELKHDLFDHILIFENFPIVQGEEEPPEEVEKPGKKDTGQNRHQLKKIEAFEQTNYDFNVRIGPGETMILEFGFNGNVYQKEFVRLVARNFTRVFNQVINNKEIKIADMEIISSEEKERVLHHFNRTQTDFPREKTIQSLFEDQVERTPGNTALVFQDQQLTYDELNKRANRLAVELKKKGIGPDVILSIIVDRSLEMIIGILGILKSGGAYLPIDPDFPRERINYIIEHSRSKLLLTQRKFSGDLVHGCTVLQFEDIPLSEGTRENLENTNTSKDLAYVIYTSGSTGQPKGVMIEHQPVSNFIKGIVDVIPFTPADAMLSLTTISFDIFNLEIFIPLVSGSKVVLGNKEEQVNSKSIFSLIKRENISIFQVTPSRLQLMLPGNMEPGVDLDNLKYLLIGGEALPRNLLDRVSQYIKGKIYNLYGPTETTIWSAVKDVSKGETLNIGKPIANTRIFILDDNMKLQPVGVPGDLYIGGDGLARGYYRDDQLTRTKFVENPFRENEKIYKTGDLARWLPDGNIEYLGRTDFQVKIRGFRIELGEIENRLLEHAAIKDAVVAARADKNDDKYLCAYVVLTQDCRDAGREGDYDWADVRAHLLEKLPYYMVPSYFIEMENVPLTANGKIDRKALPEPEEGVVSKYIAPGSDIEEKLVDMWSEALGVEKDVIGTSTNFFELGGNSIKMIGVANIIKSEFQKDIPVVKLFTYPTISSLANYLSREDEDLVTGKDRSEILDNRRSKLRERKQMRRNK